MLEPTCGFMSKLGAALGAILEKMILKGSQTRHFEAKSGGGVKTARKNRGNNMPKLLYFGGLKLKSDAPV